MTDTDLLNFVEKHSVHLHYTTSDGWRAIFASRTCYFGGVGTTARDAIEKLAQAWERYAEAKGLI